MNQNVNYYPFASNLEKVLVGKTCFISRMKKGNESINNFSTFHSLIYKILRKKWRSDLDLKSKLNGFSMRENVRVALRTVLNREPLKNEIEYYYIQLRKHFNRVININLLPNGGIFLDKYLEIVGDCMDFEESMLLGTWYLNEDIIHDIPDFDFRNIVLIQPEKLDEIGNTNALNFFVALKEWNARHKKWNIYQMDSDGKTYNYYTKPKFYSNRGGHQLGSPFLYSK